jgi:hypothetical protein
MLAASATTNRVTESAKGAEYESIAAEMSAIKRPFRSEWISRRSSAASDRPAPTSQTHPCSRLASRNQVASSRLLASRKFADVGCRVDS